MIPDVSANNAVLDELTKVNNELVNLHRDLAKRNQELADANELKNRLLGMAAHDLRSPLGVIVGYAQLLELDDIPEQRAAVREIKGTSAFMLGLVTDLLDLTAMESGRLTLRREPTTVSELLERSVATNGVLAARKNIAVRLQPADSAPTANVDRAKIEQVLNNLIGNAVKFADSGTCVEVRLRGGESEVTIEVRDRGPGIPEDELPGLFTPFATGKARGTAGETSTGLGLAIVRRIIEGHGGRVWVESKLGIGSTFAFTLPLVS